MSPIPWTAILTHGPAIVSAARTLLANQSRQAADRHASLDARLNQLEQSSVESARLLQQMAEQLQAVTAAQQEMQQKLRVALTLAGVSAAVAVIALIVAVAL
jgi:hypothetical protein